MKTILVVDDDDDIRETVALALTDDGYDVRLAVNGRDALDKLAAMSAGEPCLVLLDLTMPVMTGLEMLGVLLADGRVPGLPVIVVSSQAHEAHGLGARRLVRKPVTMDRLLTTVHEVCGQD
jgi:CheY-like chemotaxis protein